VNISQNETYKFYSTIKTTTAAIKKGDVGIRIIGKVNYWDDFGQHCEPFAVEFTIVPPHFDAVFVPPAAALCHPEIGEGEDTVYDPKSQALVGIFSLSRTHHMSHNEIVPSIPISPSPSEIPFP
jgi:hypothetical protein